MKKSGVKPHQVDEQVSRLVEGGSMRVGYGASSPIRRIVSHRLQSADSGHWFKRQRIIDLDPKPSLLRAAIDAFRCEAGCVSHGLTLNHFR
jgi:hypothetical protein